MRRHKITTEDLLADPIRKYPEATVACFDPTRGNLPRRQLDELRTVQFLERLAAVGVPALLIASSTGHGHLRTVDELRQWYRCAARASLEDTALMALLRPEDGVAQNAVLLAELQQLGYSVVFVRPGTNLPQGASDQQVVENMQPLVAEAARRGLPVGIYSIPDVSGVPLSAAAAAKLVRGPGGDHIVALKVTEAVYETSTLVLLDHPVLRHLKVVQGWDPHLARALQDGPRYDKRGRQRCGVTSGPMSLAVFQYEHIFRIAAQEDWEEVALAQQAVTQLFASMQDDPTRFADLQRAKYIMGLGQPLVGEVTTQQVERVFQALEALPRPADRVRLARSLDLLGDGPYHARLTELAQQ